MLQSVTSKYKLNRLLTLNKFVRRSNVTIDEVIEYNNILSEKPKREDFIPYDEEGKFIENHLTTFLGWSLCTETSSQKNKVAKMIENGIEYRMYFGTANGVTVISHKHACDECSYNDLAIFFEGKLRLRKVN